MSNENAGRNVLLVLIAVRLELIDRSELIGVVGQWELEPQRDLGDLLVEQDLLRPSDCKLLDAVIDMHIRKDDDSLTKSLASMGPIDPEIAIMLEATDAELPKELTRVATSVKAAGWLRRHHHWILSGAVTGSIAVLVAAMIVAFSAQSKDVTLVMIGLVCVIMIAAATGLILVGIPHLIGRALKHRWNRRFLERSHVSRRDWERAAMLHLEESMKHMNSSGDYMLRLAEDQGSNPDRLADFTVRFVKSSVQAILILSVASTLFGLWEWSTHGERATLLLGPLVALIVSGTLCASLAGPERQ